MQNGIMEVILYSILFISLGACAIFYGINLKKIEWLKLPLIMFGTFLCIFGLLFLVNGLVIYTATFYANAFDNLPMDDGTKFIELLRISVSIVTPIVTVLSAVTVATIGYVVKNKK